MRAAHTAGALVVGSMILGTMGCHKTLTARVVQPNPLCQPLETLRTSAPAVIVTGDHELRTPNMYRTEGPMKGSDKVPLHNVATFAVVSRDRLRFRVRIEHKWQEWADVTGWKIQLIDDLGNTYTPETNQLLANQHLAQMWDREQRGVVRDEFGDIVHIRNDGHENRQTMGSLSVFRGTASLAFYARDIFSAEVRSLTLRMTRQDRTLEFAWQFADEGDAATGAGDIYVSEEGYRRRRPSPNCSTPTRRVAGLP